MVKVGVIGAGFMGRTHGDAYKVLDNVELVGIANRSQEKGKKYAADYNCTYYADAADLVVSEEVDIIDICLPTYLHEKYVIMAAEAGKHILLEKPFTLSLESADRMLAAVKEAGVKFMIGQTLRFWPEYTKIREVYQERTLGSLNMIYASRLAQLPDWGEWFKDEEKSGGGLFDLHLHDIDYVCYLLGTVKSVYAVGQKSENGGWNHVISNLQFVNGTKACVEGCNEITRDYPFTMSFRGVGDLGTVDFAFQAGFNLENRDSAKNSLVLYRQDDSPQPLEVEQVDAYLNEIKYFVDCVEKNRPIEVVTPEDSREVLSVILAIKESLETGKVVELNR